MVTEPENSNLPAIQPDLFGPANLISLSTEYQTALERTEILATQLPTNTAETLTVQLNNAAGTDTKETKAPEQTSEQKAAAAAKKKEQDKLKAEFEAKTAIHSDTGFTIIDGEKITTGLPAIGDMSDTIEGFFEMILAFLTGGADLERWHMNRDFENRNNMSIEERHADDPIFAYGRPLSTQLQKDNPEEYAKTLVAAKSLLALISETESAGNENIVNDYRSRIPSLKGDGPYTSLDDGQKTLGDLTVPNFSEKTVSEIVAWQKLYIQEQKAYVDDDFPLGIPIPHPDPKSDTYEEELERRESVSERAKGEYRSSAVGQYQFTYGTLLDLMNSNYIREDELFTPEVQQRAAIGLIIKEIGDNKDLSPSQMVEEMQGRWAGLKHADPEKLLSIMETLKQDDNLTAALQSEFKLPVPT